MKLYKIGNIKELLGLLEIDDLAILEKKADYYEKFKFYRKKKNVRKIYFVSKSNPMYNIQKKLCEKFLNNIAHSEFNFGYKKGVNYFDFLECHVNRKYYMRIDIKGFFNSINEKTIRKDFDYYIDKDASEEEKIEILDLITDIVLFNDSLPQGAISSPVISNIIFRELDIRIGRYCDKLDVIYSRYADDLLFSSNSNYIHSKKFFKNIKYILKSKNFYINYDKTIKMKNYISLNGYVIENDVRLSRKRLENITKYLDNAVENVKLIDTYNKKFLVLNYLSGYRSYLICAARYCKEEKNSRKISQKILKIESTIKYILNKVRI